MTQSSCCARYYFNQKLYFFTCIITKRFTMITQHSRLRACIFWQLALIEFFERYGFYIVMALMILLLTNQMGLTDAHAYSYVAGVTALLYIAPLLGGWITDRYLDSSLALCIGSIFLCISTLISTWG